MELRLTQMKRSLGGNRMHDPIKRLFACQEQMRNRAALHEGVSLSGSYLYRNGVLYQHGKEISRRASV